MDAHTPSTFTQILDGIESLSIIVASCVALWGINAWNREHRGQRQMDLAEETLTLFYEARDVINGSPSAIGSAVENLAAAQALLETKKKPTDSARAPVITWRLYQRNDLFARIRALRYRFSAVFGSNAAKPFYDLANLRNDVISAEEEFLMIEEVARTSDGNNRERQIAHMTKLFPILHHGRTESDPTTQHLNKIVEQVDQVCRPVIEGGSNARRQVMAGWGCELVRMVQSREWVARLRRIWTHSPNGTPSARRVAPRSDCRFPDCRRSDSPM